MDAVKAFVGKDLRASAPQPSEVRRMVLPAVRILAPSTWLRHGLPVGLGYVVGKCISFHCWL